MEPKKSEKSNLENFTKLFLLLGLFLSLLFVYLQLEKETADSDNGKNLTYRQIAEDDEEDVPETEQIEEIKPPEPQQAAPPPPVLEEIEQVEDDAEVEETVIESTESSEDEAIEIEEVEEVEVEEEIVEDVSFRVIEDAPVYPGCSGNKEQLKKCFSQKVKKFVNSKFDTELANELGLPPGKKRINVQFVVSKTGEITNIRVRAPHKRLEKEARRVISLLPKLKPGKQRGKPVGVKYNLPIVFLVTE
jgi:protein TonB